MTTPHAHWSKRPVQIRHPFVLVSLLLHALLAMALYHARPAALQREARGANTALEQARRQARKQDVAAALDQARRRQMQRHLQNLEAMAQQAGEALPAPAAGSAPQDMLARAQQLAQQLQQRDQAQRAKELARLLKITPEQALAQVKADDQAKAKLQTPAASAAVPPEQALAQLERQAREASERRRDREWQQSQGHAVAGSSSSREGAAAHGQGQGAQGQGGGTQAGQQGRGSEGGGGPGDGHRSIGGIGEPERRYDNATAAALPAGPQRLSTGRIIGPGGAFSQRIYLDRWYVVGPFPGPSSQALHTVYGPERGIDLDAVYQGRQGQLIGWQPVHSPTYPFIPPPATPDAVFYAYTELRVDRDQTVWLDIGADDDSKLWVNDQLVWTSGNGDKPWYHRPFYRMDAELDSYGLVEGSRQVRLHAGRNTLLFKLYNGIDLMFFSVVVRP